MKYTDLTIHQRINAKGLIMDSKGEKFFNFLLLLWVVSDFREAIDMMLFKLEN